MRFRTIIAVTLFTITMAGYRPTGARSQEVMVMGAIDCVTWHVERRFGNPRALQHWVMGMINGIAYGSGFDFWRFDNPPSSMQVFLRIDNFCTQNPQDMVATGVAQLFDERLKIANERLRAVIEKRR